MVPPLTPSQTIGPFFGFGLEPAEELVPPDSADAVRIRGKVVDGSGDPVTDAMLETWQADRAGRYAHPADGRGEPPLEHGFTGFGRSLTDERGEFRFVTVKPGPVPAPDGRRQAPHIGVLVYARGLLRQLATRIYFPDEEAANGADPVLSALGDPELRSTLLARPDGDSLRFDVHLQGDHETAFFHL